MSGDNIPQGPTMLELKAVKAPKGEYQRVETVCGELGVYIVSDGGLHHVFTTDPNFRTCSSSITR
jgi:NADH:ubiquinone oxidoreductase subunit D